jgi:hypothetical protein
MTSKVSSFLSGLWDTLVTDEKAAALPILAKITAAVAGSPTKATFVAQATTGLIELASAQPGIIADELTEINSMLTKATVAALAPATPAAAAPAAAAAVKK